MFHVVTDLHFGKGFLMLVPNICFMNTIRQMCQLTASRSVCITCANNKRVGGNKYSVCALSSVFSGWCHMLHAVRHSKNAAARSACRQHPDLS